MLRITKSKNPKAATEYLTNAMGVNDYYFIKEEVYAIWKGQAAKRLKLKGKKVTKETFSKLVRNLDPITGKQLTPKSGAHRTCGYELCFNANKSVSILMMLQDEKVLEAHRKAVDFAMEAVEQDIHVQQTKNGKNTLVKTGNLIRADFEHFTTRPLKQKGEQEEIYIADPHLHTHVYIPSVSWNEQKNRYQAIEMGPVHKVASYYESLFHSALAMEIQKLGYKTVRTSNGFEVAGISKAMRDKFSGRTIEIEAIAKAQGIYDAKSKSKIGAKSRNKKSAQAKVQLKELWKERLSETELSQLQNLKHQKNKASKGIAPKTAIERALQHFLEREAAVPEKRILSEAMRLTYGFHSPTSIEKEWMEKDDILIGNKQGVEYATTVEMSRLEKAVLNSIVNGKGRLAPIDPSYKIEADFLSDQQREAISKLLSSTSRFQAIVGAAGSGKTSLLKEVKAAVEKANKKLFSFCPSSDASRRVMRSKGFENSDTVASLLQNSERQKELFKQVVLIDEAGLLSTRDMRAIQEIVEKQQARVIFSGDPAQLSSIGAGSCLKQMMDYSRIETATVNTVVRQQTEPYRQAIQSMAENKIVEGFQKLDRIGAIKEFEQPQERFEALAKDYIQSLEQRRSALVVAPTHAEKNALNEVIRDQLKEKQMIHGEEKVFAIQPDKSLTNAQKKDPVHYDENTMVRFHLSDHNGFQAGKTYPFFSKNEKEEILLKCPNTGQDLKLPVESSEKFTVHHKAKLPIAKGDQIRITANSKNREGSRINNGQTYGVNGFTKEGHIQLSNGKTLDKDHGQIAHAHVVTVHASQGRDAKDVYLSLGSLADPAIHEKSFYVGASRGTQQLKIYTDDKQELKKSIQRNRDAPTALEIQQKHDGKRMEQYRRDYYRQSITKEQQQIRTKNHGHEQKVER